MSRLIEQQVYILNFFLVTEFLGLQVAEHATHVCTLMFNCLLYEMSKEKISLYVDTIKTLISYIYVLTCTLCQMIHIG